MLLVIISKTHMITINFKCLCESKTTYMRVKIFCLNASSKNADIQLGHRTQSVSDITLYQVAQSQTTGMPNNLKVSASKEDMSLHSETSSRSTTFHGSTRTFTLRCGVCNSFCIRDFKMFRWTRFKVQSSRCLKSPSLIQSHNRQRNSLFWVIIITVKE